MKPLPARDEDNTAAMLAQTDTPSSNPTGSRVVRFLHWLIVAGVLGLVVSAASALTWPGEEAWALLLVPALFLWVLWLYWRTLMGQVHMPGHLFYPFLAAPILILLGHLVHQDPIAPGRVGMVIAGDMSILLRLMALALMVLLVQDVLSRLRHLRWLLTGAAVALAAGSTMRLHGWPESSGSLAVALIGLSGSGMLVAPLLIPRLEGSPWILTADDAARAWWLPHAERIARVCGAALAAVLICARQPKAAAIAAAVAGAVMLTGGGLLRGQRLRLMPAGAILAAGGFIGLHRLGMWLPAERLATGLFGVVEPEALAAAADMGGLPLLLATTGYVGGAMLAIGLAAAVVYYLAACRRAARGDQVRAVVWSVTTGICQVALLVSGGLSVPAVAAAAALTLGLTPHILAVRARSIGGWPVALAFAALMFAVGMEQGLGGRIMGLIARRHGDAVVHFGGALVLTVVLFWQFRARQWWAGLICASLVCLALVAGEWVQDHFTASRSFENSDAAADALGAGAALAILLALDLAVWLERKWDRRPGRIARERYEIHPVG